ncbi:hypothetical protein BC567DRAFT_228921 [Phyllosticta citribraziliensis]
MQSSQSQIPLNSSSSFFLGGSHESEFTSQLPSGFWTILAGMRSVADTWLAFLLAGGSVCRWSSTSGRLASVSLASKSPCENLRSLRFRKKFIQESSMRWQSQSQSFLELDRSGLSFLLTCISRVQKLSSRCLSQSIFFFSNESPRVDMEV